MWNRCHGYWLYPWRWKGEKRNNKGGKTDGSKVGCRVKQRESPKSRRKQQEWRRVTPVGTSSFDIVCSSRRSRNYPSIAKRDALVSLSWLLFRSFFPSAAIVLLFTAFAFFVASRTSRWTRSHPLDQLRDHAALLSAIGRVTCRLSSGSFNGNYLRRIHWTYWDADTWFKSLHIKCFSRYRYESGNF